MARGRNRQNQGPRMLDRSRPFSTIMYAEMPEGRYAAFQQDGSTFDVSGKLLKEGPAPEKPTSTIPATPAKSSGHVRGYSAEDDTVDRKAQQAATGGANQAARAAVLANFGMSDPLDEQRSVMRENAAADAVERENAE